MRIYCDLKKSEIKLFFIFLITIEVCLALIYVIFFCFSEPIWIVERLFDLDGEANVPTWFTSIQLFMIGFFALLFFFQKESSLISFRRLLFVFGVSFIFFSLDEVCQIHERVTIVFRDISWMPKLNGRRAVGILLYLILGGIVCLLGMRDLKNLWKAYTKEATVILVGLVTYVFGVAGMEVINIKILQFDEQSRAYFFQVLIEESLEMLGASIILYGILQLIIPIMGSNKT